MSTRKDLQDRLHRVETLMDTAAENRDRATGANREKWRQIFLASLRELLSLNRALRVVPA